MPISAVLDIIEDIRRGRMVIQFGERWNFRFNVGVHDDEFAVGDK